MAELVNNDEADNTGGDGDEVKAEAPPPAAKGRRKRRPMPNVADPSSPLEKTNQGVMQLVERMRSQGVIREKKGPDALQAHKFWDTQPVPKMSEALARVSENGPIEADKPISEIRQEPYNMPEGFTWCELDVTDAGVLREIYTLLNENYVEDDDAMFRFDYSMAFLEWALTPPNFEPSWHLGVRAARGSKRLMAFITGVPATASVRGKRVKVVEINYLCVHKRLRTKRLAPVLIKEITRRVNLRGIFQAVYTAGVVLPKPVASCRYYHRSLDPKKLIEIGFSRLMPRMTMARTIKLYKLPDEPLTPGLRQMTPADVPKAHALLAAYLERFPLHPHMDPDEFAHWCLPRAGVIDSFVVEAPSGELTDLCSFYHLPSTVIGNDKHSTLRAAYSFYNVATSVPLADLMRDALICAKRVEMDVFNALNIMENDAFLKPLKFGIGDGHLQYYLYNWKCAEMESKDIGLVLL